MTGEKTKEFDRADTGTTASPSVRQILPQPAHTLPSDKLVQLFKTDPLRGLSDADVASLASEFGPNRIKPPRKPSLWRIMGRQIVNAMTLVLIAATAVSLGTMDWISGGVIMALVVMNVGVGTYTEWQAEKTVAGLESVGSPTATVIRHDNNTKGRDGRTQTVNIEEVVPGDIIVLVNGDIVPADARILDGYLSALESDEALLTGESLPVAKTTDIIEEHDCPVGDRINMVFSGSQITKGRARAIVTSTGMATELGAIAAALERKESTGSGWQARKHKIKAVLGLADTTSLQIKLNWLAYILLGLACLVALIVVASTAFDNIPLSVATYAVAAAVSLLPASLIAVVSLTLAQASNDLAKRKALVRRMDAIEGIAQVTDVCSDKTGTLTVGKMVLKRVWIPARNADATDTEGGAEIDTDDGQSYEVEGGRDPFYPRGAVTPLNPSHSRENDDDDGDNTGGVDDDLDDALNPQSLEGNLRNLVLCGSLCNMATISHAQGDEDWSASGDATEIALQVFAHKLGHGKPHLTHPPRAGRLGQIRSRDSTNAAQGRDLTRTSSHMGNSANLKVPSTQQKDVVPVAPSRGHYEMLVEHSFDSSVKRMSTAWRFVPESSDAVDSHVLCFMKGAVERTLERCDHVGLNSAGPKLGDDEKENIIARMDTLAEEGLRVLALCGRRESSDRADEISKMSREDMEKDFGFLGLVGIYDPPRPESAGAVADCKTAGIVPRMLTGDHPATGVAIARQIGILDRNAPKSAVMTGQQFDALSEEEIDKLPELPVVIARCAPETKVRMVEALHRRKRATIMTGDGVNDSPALKRADVGVAMGLNGSDVAKQSAEIVLADDNFSTIIRAVRKGRSVFSNLSKFLLFLISGNLAEVIVLLIGLAFRDETGISVFPLSPVAALWINTLAAGPPAFALGLEPTAKDAMVKPPAAYHTIFTLEWFLDLVFYGFLIGALALINFVIVVYGRYDGYLGVGCNEGENGTCFTVFAARATCFSTLVLLLMVHSFTCKHVEKSIFKMNLLDNKLLLWVVLALSLATFPVVYIPVINSDVFLLDNMSWEWGIVFAAIIIYFAFAELWKLWRRSRLPKAPAVVNQDKTLRMADTVEPGTMV